MAKPVIKWVGGKTQLLKELKSIITPELLEGHTYFEPFIGGGAMAFNMEHRPTVINDLNSELINLYNVVAQRPEELIAMLHNFEKAHSDRSYYEIRAWDRNPKSCVYTNPVARAARTVYLNKTCFNGLYRVNSQGYFNSPVGRTSSGKTPVICDEEAIRNLSNFLKTNCMIMNKDYKTVASMAKAGDTVYLDPPYDSDEDIKSEGFVGYQKDGWTRTNTLELKALCDSLVAKGVHVVVSNNDTDFIRETFKDYEIREVSVKRNINRDGNSRKGREVIIYKL